MTTHIEIGRGEWQREHMSINLNGGLLPKNLRPGFEIYVPVEKCNLIRELFTPFRVQPGRQCGDSAIEVQGRWRGRRNEISYSEARIRAFHNSDSTGRSWLMRRYRTATVSTTAKGSQGVWIQPECSKFRFNTQIISLCLREGEWIAGGRTMFDHVQIDVCGFILGCMAVEIWPDGRGILTRH